METSEKGQAIGEIDGNIGVITIDNKANYNALSFKILNDITKILNEFKEKSVTVVIIRAQKDCKVWSSGHDINELPLDKDPLSYFDPIEETLRAIQCYPGPVIAMIQGGVWGGACDLAITCDFIIADSTCSFAITPVKLGLPYNATGVLHFINRVGINIAKEMFFTAKPIEAKRALMVGILNHLVDTNELEAFTFKMANDMAKHSKLSIAVIKEQFRILSNAYTISPEAFEMIQGMRRQVYFSKDYIEGITAFKEKRQPKFTGG